MSLNFGVIEEISRRGAEEVCVEWQIPNFPSLLDGEDGDWYGSPVFRMGDGSWCLGMWPNCGREARNPTSGWVALDLWRCDRGPPATFRFSLGISGSGGLEKSGEGEKEFKAYYSYAWDDFCSRSYLLEHRTRLMPEDTLNIRCVLKRPGADRGVLSHPHSSDQVAPNGSQSSDKQDVCTQTDFNVESEVQESTVKRGQYSSNKCVICLEGSVDTAVYRCGHMYTCYDCALKLKKSNSHCPMCRKPIQDILKIYSDCS